MTAYFYENFHTRTVCTRLEPTGLRSHNGHKLQKAPRSTRRVNLNTVIHYHKVTQLGLYKSVLELQCGLIRVFPIPSILPLTSSGESLSPSMLFAVLVTSRSPLTMADFAFFRLITSQSSISTRTTQTQEK